MPLADMEENKEIEVTLRSESMNQLLAHPPSWIVRSGNGLFLLLIVLVLGLSWLIEYPDEITGEVTVSTSESPIELTNQLHVQLKHLAVKDGQQVSKNQVLAQFDNQANTEDIRLAETYLYQLVNRDKTTQRLLPTSSISMQLGTFQGSWTNLQTLISEWNSLLTSNIANEQMATIKREIHYRKQLQSIADKKIQLSENEYALIAEELLASERLSEQHALSKQAINQEKRSKTQAMQTVQSHKEQYVQNLIELNSLQEQLLQLKLEKQQQERAQISSIEMAIAKLQNDFIAWRKDAVWIAPCTGKIVFNKHLQLNKFYGTNEASIVLVPNGNTYTAIAKIASAGAGKVKMNQKAYIELVDYPKFEYGMLEGVVKKITQIDKEGKYEVEIVLPKQLITTYQKTVPMKAQLKGRVKIITKKKRLLERIFENLTSNL